MTLKQPQFVIMRVFPTSMTAHGKTVYFAVPEGYMTRPHVLNADNKWEEVEPI